MTIPTFQLRARYKKLSFGAMALGAAALAAGLFLDPSRAWANFLINNFYYLSLGLAGLFFMAIHFLAGSGWWTVLRRIPEAMSAILPVMAVLMFALIFSMTGGAHGLYHWADHEAVLHDPILTAKQAYLNVPFFFGRMAAIFALWVLFAWIFRKTSRSEDSAVDLRPHKTLVRASALFVPIFALTFSVASVDWIMSLEPHWFSTIFSLYTFSGLFLHGLSVITLMVVLLKERGHLEGFVNESHLHDLGKLVFAFSTFWAYIWVSQYLLIWYSNIPEETSYFIIRTDPDWSWLFLLNLVLNWLIPFVILMPRGSKRNPAVLKRVCVTLLVGHWLDLYLMVMPNTVGKRWIGPLEVLVAVGYGALFFYVVGKALGRAPLVPKKDPYLAESLHHHT
jgi:hypothetical protein